MTINVLEIRNYLFKPDMLEHFIDFFETHFIFSQQAVNMHILGQFRLAGEPDRFVWLRGFSDMQTRLEGLRSFYGGDVWKKYRAVANEMMLESENVHLLRPLGNIADLTAGLSADTVAADLAAGTISPYTGMIAVDFYQAIPGKRDALIDPVLSTYAEQAIEVRGHFVAEMSENAFPALPAIQNEDEWVVITAYASEAECREKRAKVQRLVDETVGSLLTPASPSLLLSPTLRSPLRYQALGK
jgi:hypothetical protein